MRKVELLTMDGGYVATVEIAPFPDAGMPRVVRWGERTFVSDRSHPELGERPWPYREYPAAVSLTESPGLERWRAPPPPPVDESQRAISGRAHVVADADTTITPTGQQREYTVLSDAERRKGFVRPVRRSYKHVGAAGPAHPVRDLTAEETERYSEFGYVKYEAYPQPSHSLGRFWTQAQLDAVGKGCGSVTWMSPDIAETYSRSPAFYGSTLCVVCGTHLPVGPTGEFVWEGTNERVGT